MSELYDDPNDDPPLSRGADNNTIVVLSNLPDKATALKMANELLDQKLIACANVMAPCTSVYQWQGKVQQEDEVPVLMKTTRRQWPALMQAIERLHPYDVPEIVMLSPGDVLPAYAQWVANSTRD